MTVKYEKKTHIATITINNPDKGNILDRQTSADIAAVWQEGVGRRRCARGHPHRRGRAALLRRAQPGDAA